MRMKRFFAVMMAAIMMMTCVTVASAANSPSKPDASFKTASVAMPSFVYNAKTQKVNGKVKVKVKTSYGYITLKEGTLVEDKKDIPQQAPVDPYKGMTKAERRRARREAEQRAAEAAKAEILAEDPVPVTETAEEAPLEEVSAEQVVEEVNNTVEEVEQSAEEAASEEVVEEEKVEE